MPEPVGTDIIEDVQDNVDRIYEKINKSVDTIIK